jgi:hypothetical protein
MQDHFFFDQACLQAVSDLKSFFNQQQYRWHRLLCHTLRGSPYNQQQKTQGKSTR